MHDLAVPLPIPILTRRFEATLRPPGSKSITCRAYLLAALAEGESRIVRPLRSADTDGLLAALGTLGAESRWDGDDVVVTGVAGRFPRGGCVNLGDGGTPARFMLAAALCAREPVEVDGSPRMRERPVAEGLAMLRALGADVTCLGAPEQLPVRIAPPPVHQGGSLALEPTRSSQFISALLLVAPWLGSPLELKHPRGMTSRTYVDLTVDLLRQWGSVVECDEGVAGARQRVEPGAVSARTFEIEPDASSAVYWWTAAAIGPAGSQATVAVPARSRQPDAAYPARILERLGAEVRADAAGITVVGHGQLVPPSGALDMEAMPDAAVALGAALARATGTVTVRGLHTLAVKETDRLSAVAAELERVGCAVQRTAEALIIDPRAAHDRPVDVATYGDHRMAMAFAVLGLARGGVRIENPACVSKSYPGFFDDLATLADATPGPTDGGT